MKHMKYFFILTIVSMLLVPSSHATEETKHLPLVIPLRLHGIGNSLGVGYAGSNLVKNGDFAGLAFIGDMQGVNLSLSDLTFADDWIRLDARLGYLNKLTPTSNYSRGSEAKPILFKPQLKLSSIEMGLSVQPSKFVFLKIAPGKNISQFGTFHTESGETIETPSIHITDLNQSYLKTELGVKYAGKKNLSYVSAVGRLINRNKSSGYSGDLVTSYRIDGQYSYYGNNAIYLQYFHSDANVNDKTNISSSTDISNTLNIDCNTSSTSQDCQKLNQALTSYIANHNKYGTAETLGGPERMRAYPLNYFRAAHSRYAVIELRFENFDNLDGKQFFLRFFSEAAQIADQEKDLNDSTVLSNGFDVGVNVNKDINYKLTAAKGNDGWVAHLALTRSW